MNEENIMTAEKMHRPETPKSIMAFSIVPNLKKWPEYSATAERSASPIISAGSLPFSFIIARL